MKKLNDNSPIFLAFFLNSLVHTVASEERGMRREPGAINGGR